MAKTKTAAAKKTSAKKATPKKPAATKAKTATAKKAAPKKATAPKAKTAKKTGEEEVKLDRRRAAERRDEAAESVPAEQAEAAGPPLERREKVSRRRQIDPTTCERDYSDAEVDFMNALDAYKRSSGRMFPTCSEVLEVVRGMGYVQLNAVELASIKAGRGEIDQPTDLEGEAEREATTALDESEELRID